MTWTIVGYILLASNLIGATMYTSEDVSLICYKQNENGGEVFIVEKSSESYRFTKGRCEPERIVPDEPEKLKGVFIEICPGGGCTQMPNFPNGAKPL